jgi:hypothetical protein
MGPIALFDKSFLQSINLDEAVWFDHFFLPVVCPIFFVETLADLAKEPSKHGSAEAVVKGIAQKFPELGGSPCAFHVDIAINDLRGLHVPMDGRVPRAGGRSVKSGTVYESTAEDLAFGRWQQGKFHDVEKIVATTWRKSLAELDLGKVASELRSLGIDGKSCKSLEQAKHISEAVVSSTGNVYAVLTLASIFLHIPQQFHHEIIEAWKREGRRALSVFAPYAAHVVSIEIFFQIALAANLIATERPSNRADIAYLFYLPFSMLFVSTDNLHRRTAPLFMRPDQEFVWGIDLKMGLKTVNTHFLALPESVREGGIMSFASVPPDGNAVAGLWDRHMRSNVRKEPKVERNSEGDAELVKRLKEFRKQPTLDLNNASDAEEEMISIARKIRRKRGNWWQVPKNLPDTDDDD